MEDSADILAAIADVATGAPAATAVEWDGGSLSYGELWDLSARRARFLEAHGAAPGVIVGLALPRGPELALELLAILRTGAAYAPLDLAYPADRLADMVRLADVRFIVADTPQLPWAGNRAVVQAAPLHTLRAPANDGPAAGRSTAPHTVLSADRPLYLIFTSGSTGSPKAVCMGQAPIANLLAWQRAEGALGHPARTLQFTPVSFDVHVQEFLGTWTTGGTLVLVDEPTRRDPVALLRVLAERHIERLYLPYVALQQLADTAARTGQRPASLRDVITAGEQLITTPALRAFFASLPQTRLHNHYGPSETHVATACILPERVEQWDTLPPIGVPIRGTQALLVSEAGDVVPGAGEGELWLGGECLALGYLGQPERTAERFVTHPVLGGRWYRTGDLVRRDADGVLRFLGRNDAQVKLRGHRVEIGEVEHAIGSINGVAMCAARVAPTAGGDRQLVAYVVLRTHADRQQVERTWRATVEARVPEYMVPQRLLVLDSLPLTASGKVDRLRLPDPGDERPALATEYVAPANDREWRIAACWERALGIRPIGAEDRFVDLGGTSLLAVQLAAELEHVLGTSVPVAHLYAYPTIRQLAVATEPASETASIAGGAPTAPSPAFADEPIAVVGMVGRFPGADSVDELWRMIVEGREGLTRFTAEELASAGVPTDRLHDPGFVPVRGLVRDAEYLDAEFFGISAREAELMDPQHRLFLETCWSALEVSGHIANRATRRIGVWGGQSTGMEHRTYMLSNLWGNSSVDSTVDAVPMMLGSAPDYLTTRVSHRLGLRGPSMGVQTACSTSLVAIAQACLALRRGECDMALAGGVSVAFPQKDGYLAHDGGIESDDGHCRPFDAQASGTVFGDGVAVVVLKRLADAVADGDTVYAVVRGVGVNNDGASKASFAAPSVEGQVAVIRAAHQDAGIAADTVALVECHGTATAIGDALELSALTQVFGAGPRSARCTIGSVKSNIGHVVGAAGAAGFIKTVLALHHKVLPPTAHFTQANPALALDRTPFDVRSEAAGWHADGTPRRAGVSAFGVGGTNAHIVLEEAQQDSRVPAVAAADDQSGAALCRILPLSARSATARTALRTALATCLDNEGDAPSLADIQYTLQEGRQAFGHRLVVIARERHEAAQALRGPAIRRVAQGDALPVSPRLAFLFAGVGSHTPGMAAELAALYPVVREWLEQGVEALRSRTGINLAPVWFAPDAAVRARVLPHREQLPATIITQVALARLLGTLGVTPALAIGHSLGEITAAHLAGAMQFADAIELAAVRGLVFDKAGPGALLSVALDEAEAQGLAGDELDVGILNGPANSVLSGSVAAIEAVIDKLRSSGVEYTRLPITVATHSRLLDAHLSVFRKFVRGMPLSAPTFDVISNLTGTALTGDQATDPEYWVAQLRGTVRYGACISSAAADPQTLFVDIGPGRGAGTLARLHPQVGADRVVSVMRHGLDTTPEDDAVALAVGQLWTRGTDIDWGAWRNLGGNAAPARRVPLPTYPFERRPYLIEPTRQPAATSVDTTVNAPVVDTAEPTPPRVTMASAANRSRRTERIHQRIVQVLQDVSGMPAESLGGNGTFLEMGFDSLFLTQASLRLRKEFAVPLGLRQMYEVAPTITALAAYIDHQMPAEHTESAEAIPVSSKGGTTPAPVAVSSSSLLSTAGDQYSGASPDILQQAIALQIQANTALLAALQSSPTAARHVPATPGVSGAAAASPPDIPAPSSVSPETGLPNFVPTVSRPSATGRFGPFKPLQKHLTQPLSASQAAYLTQFTQRVQAKTPGSKAFTAANRSHYADPRAVAGFKQAWKEITYPIVGERSKGALMWDVDGNEYVDCVGGFGAAFFGHNPDFVAEAVRAQFDVTLDYGPQSRVAGEVAKAIAEITGHERAAFCNTGSEAVLAAMRMVRTASGNDLIVSFGGSYHGMLDEVLVRPQDVNGRRANRAVAPGIPQSASSNMVVLEYGDPASLQYIEQIADQLAGVLVEPIQSRNPELQPVAFVRELRALTERLGLPLIFDEVITGFRIHPRGAQGWYGVDADLCTYGKVIGGGMPIGVVAGKARYMDALDGGAWQYGDSSFPEAGVTYFAGTFVRHPTALAAASAVVKRLRDDGPALQARISRRTAAFCERVNRSYHALGVPIELTYFASVMLPRWYGDPDYESLYFHHLRYHGAHIWEGRPGFFTVEHTDAHMDRLHASFVRAAEDMRAGGFLPAAPDSISVAFTPAQRELWMAMQFGDEARRAYNEQVVFAFATTVDHELLDLAFDKVVNRHQSLRAVVRADGEGFSILPYVRPGFTTIDLRHLSAESAEGAAIEALQEHIGRPFDVHTGPLVRLFVAEMPNGCSWLAVAASHLVCDGWSMDVLMQDLVHYYEAMREGRQVDRGTPPTAVEFEQLVQQRLAAPEFAEARAWWRAQFTPLPVPADLPFDYSRPPVPTYHGRRERTELPAELAEPLREFARARGCTLFVAALAAYELLLHKLSGSDDFVIGIPSAGQPTLGFNKLIAHDVRFLPLRATLTGTDTVLERMQRLRGLMATAQEHADLTFGDLIGELRPPRVPGRMPLITAAFNMDLEMSPLVLHGAPGTFITTPRSLVKYDLFFNVIDLGAGRGLTLEVDFNTDLMHADTAARWTAMYVALLEQLPTLAEVPLPKVTLPAAPSTVAGAGTALSLGGASTDAPTAPHTLVSMFEAAVDAHPGRTAVLMDGGESYTYAALDARANQIAHWLQREGVQANDVVAVLFDRSLSLIDAVYGVVKGGGAYLPLDPGNPAARLAEIVQAAQPKLLLCLQADLAKVAAWVPMGVQVRALDAADAPWRTAPIARPTMVVQPEQLAYVIYTSGSTGNPKGVMVEHRAIASRLRWAQRATPLAPTDTVLHKTPFTFDVSVWELFWTLHVGARLVLAVPGGHKDPRYLRDVIARERISVLHFVPSMFGAFLAECGDEILDGIRMVLCSGEALTTAHRDRSFAVMPATRLINLYGPTEAAIDVAWWECRRSDTDSTVPIGVPVDDTTLYVLDEQARPVPHGVAGELYIGGVQLARGYLHDDARTAAAFVTIEIGGERVRAYRTGDLVRQRHDGALEFLGRRDHQVKLRGFRIELGEVEGKLLAQDGVQTAAVLVVHHAEGDDRLVAFVQPAPGIVLSQLALRRGLANRLPDYMVPSVFTVVETMPLNSSGKIDRRALGDQYAAAAAPTAGAAYRAPDTPAEQRVAAIWGRALKADRISADAYFFDVGGHSLLAVGVAREMEAALGRRYDLRELLMSNLMQLAALAERQDSGAA